MTNPIHAWLEIESQILAAKRPIESAFAAVNLAHGLAPYRQAVLWSDAEGVVALSGAAAVESGAPYVLWLGRLFAHLRAKAVPASQITAADLSPALAEQWGEWLPVHALVAPSADEIVLFARDEPFDEGESQRLQRLATLAHLSRRALAAPSNLASRFKALAARKVRVGLAAALVIAAFPITGSVLAPAELVPAHPVVVRAPLDGVVDRIRVQPNEAVTEGQPLFDLDATVLAGKLEVARQQQATAEAEYRQAAQAMVFDPKAKAQIAILAGKSEEKAAEARLLDSQLTRIGVKSPKAGMAVFDDVSDWIGKPVVVGEKVMVVTDETDTEIEAWTPAADVGEVKPGARLTLFLNTNPLAPVHGVVRTVAYEAAARPDATMAHRVRATLAEGEAKLRLGLKGTARIDGDTVPLVWWLFRRPLAVVRQFVGI
jgi:multidrug resistance efflux pump